MSAQLVATKVLAVAVASSIGGAPQLDASSGPPTSALSPRQAYAAATTDPAQVAPEPGGAAKRSLPPMTIAGIVVMASAAAGIGLMITGLVQGGLAEDAYHDGPSRQERDQADMSGARANTTAFVGAVSTGVLLGVGAALIVLGQRLDLHEPPAHARVRRHGLGVRF